MSVLIGPTVVMFQNSCIWRIVKCGHNGCIWTKWLYLRKVVVLEKKVVFGQNGWIWAKCLHLGKIGVLIRND